jgi:hypothetical protein
MKIISKACSSGWSAVSWWHAAQSNHFLQHGERIETWALRTCLLLRSAVDGGRGGVAYHMLTVV